MSRVEASTRRSGHADPVLAGVGVDARRVRAPVREEAEVDGLAATRGGAQRADEPALAGAPRERHRPPGRARQQARVVPGRGHRAQQLERLGATAVAARAVGVVLEPRLVHDRLRELRGGARDAPSGAEGHRRVVHRADHVAREGERDVVGRVVGAAGLAVLGAAHAFHRHHVRPRALQPARHRAAVEADQQVAGRGVGGDVLDHGHPLAGVRVQEVGLHAGDAPGRPLVEHGGALSRGGERPPVGPQQHPHAALGGVRDEVGDPAGVPARVDQDVLEAHARREVDVVALVVQARRAPRVRPPRPGDAPGADPRAVGDPRRRGEVVGEVGGDDVGERADDRDAPARGRAQRALGGRRDERATLAGEVLAGLPVRDAGLGQQRVGVAAVARAAPGSRSRAARRRGTTAWYLPS